MENNLTPTGKFFKVLFKGEIRIGKEFTSDYTKQPWFEIDDGRWNIDSSNVIEEVK